MSEAPIVVDISALQSPESRGRGIARFALGWSIALERTRPDLVRAYALNPRLAPPGSLGELAASDKLVYASGAIYHRATIVHQLSPFDLTQPAGSLLATRAHGQLTSATVYDLIPALEPELLSDPVVRRRYRTRLELVRSLHHIQTLSHGVAAGLEAMFGIDPARITAVGAAPDAAFTPPKDRASARDEAIGGLRSSGLRRDYVLYVSGSHPRKNNELLIEAWSKLPSGLSDRFQLVITGDFDASTVHHFRHLATNLGIEGAVVTPGHLADEEIVMLTKGAALACFASRYEGFGLPIVEALACETPVIASAISPHDELLGADALFDATSAEAIASALVENLSSPDDRRTRQSARVATWTEVAERSAASFDSMLAQLASRPTPRPRRRRRPRIAVVTPLPPAPTGIARYSYRFVEEMAATDKVEVVCFADGPTTHQAPPENISWHRVESLRHVEMLTGRFDEVVYVMGNSHHHLGALAMLNHRRGLVVSHDVRLSNLYRHAHGDPGLLPGGLGREIAKMYDQGLPSTLGSDGELTEEDLERYGLLMARDVISLSTGFVVTSQSARRLAEIDARPASARKIATLPFAMEMPRLDGPGFIDATEPPPALIGRSHDLWGRGAPPDDDIYLAHFGIVDPIKVPDLLVDALGHLRENARVRLVFVGPISHALCSELVERARSIGLEDRVGFTGPLAPGDYLTWLRRASIAIQLRDKTNGEASAAIGECLASGLATVVSDVGWSSELPRDCVQHVRTHISSDELAADLSALLDNGRRRRAIGDAAAVLAGQNSFNYAARALIAHIADRSRERQRAGVRA